MDSAIFRQVDNLINHPNYKELINKLDVLTDEQVKIFNHAMAYLIISLPIMFFLIVLMYYFNVKGKLDNYKEILTTVDQITSEKRSVSSLERTLISPGVATNTNEFSSKIGGILSRYTIPVDKVTVKTFATEKNSGNITRSRSQVVFSRFSSKNLADFLMGLTINQKLKIIDIEIKKTEDRTQLFGQMTIIHYGKN